MNSLTCFSLVGGIIFIMASTFLFIGWIPFWVTQKSKYSISVCPKNDFSMLHLSLLSLRFYRISSKMSKWSDQSPLVIIKRSSMYAWINSNPRNISLIFFWKISGEWLTPIVRRLYWYFPQDRIIFHRLLACSLIRIQ